MTRKVSAKRDPDRCPSHPGAVLREIVLPEVRATKSAVAAALKMSRNQLHLILSEKQSVTPETAVKLEAAFGGSARIWLNMQAAFDLWHAQRKVDISKIPSMRAA